MTPGTEREALLREALEDIAALDDDDHDPGYSASPDYYVGISEAALIAREALADIDAVDSAS